MLTKTVKIIPALMATLLMVAAIPAEAAEQTYKLVRTSPIGSVSTAAGRINYDSGYVYIGSYWVGSYARQVNWTPSAYNGNYAAVEMSIIFGWAGYNFTVQGRHSPSGYGQIQGGVSSEYGFPAFDGATVTGTSNQMTVTY